MLYLVCVKFGMGCVIVEGDSLALFTALENSPRNVVSGIRYIRNSLYPVCVKSDMSCYCPRGLLSTFYSFEKFSKKHYIRYTLYPVCVKSAGMACVIVEWDSLAILQLKCRM